MKPKVLFILLLGSIFVAISCTFELVLPSKEPIADPIIKKPVLDTVMLPIREPFAEPISKKNVPDTALILPKSGSDYLESVDK